MLFWTGIHAIMYACSHSELDLFGLFACWHSEAAIRMVPGQKSYVPTFWAVDLPDGLEHLWAEIHSPPCPWDMNLLCHLPLLLPARSPFHNFQFHFGLYKCFLVFLWLNYLCNTGTNKQFCWLSCGMSWDGWKEVSGSA